MKKIIVVAILVIASSNALYSQNIEKPAKIGWFLTPEVGAMVLNNHVGKTVGGSFGIKILKDRLKIGIMGYGRPGPLNSATFDTKPINNQIYKGQSTLKLRGDWGTFGLMLAPTFKIKNIEIDVPVSYGAGIGGFYLVGDDRITPDGDKVSKWENKLFDGKDAGFGSLLEVGTRVFIPTKTKGFTYGAGVHYTMIKGWETLYDPSGKFYDNKIRFSLFMNFGSH